MIHRDSGVEGDNGTQILIYRGIVMDRETETVIHRETVINREIVVHRKT